MDQQLIDDMKAARAVIEKPGTWTQEALARDRNLNSTSSYDTDACMWCTVGAVRKALNFDVATDPSVVAREVNVRRALQDAVGGGIIWFNDRPGRTQDEVLAAFDKAIAKAQQP